MNEPKYEVGDKIFTKTFDELAAIYIRPINKRLSIPWKNHCNRWCTITDICDGDMKKELVNFVYSLEGSVDPWYESDFNELFMKLKLLD